MFFDALGISYGYEVEGFETGLGPYLPDFWLPQQDCWIEIKGKAPTHEETRRLQTVCNTTEKMGFIFFGSIPMPNGPTENNSAHALWWDDGGWDCDYRWCQCPVCGKLGIQYEGLADRLGCGCGLSHKTRTADAPPLLAAYIEARSVRFGEHRAR